MIKKVFCIIGLVITCSVYGQSYEKHKVEIGETITQIAQKYKVTPFDIYQLNPDAQSGLKPNSILLIPKKGTSVKTVSTSTQNHKVITGETLFAIEKKYGITDEALKKVNPFLEKDGLQIGQLLVIPAIPNTKVTLPIPEKVIYHEVLPKETKYSIAKQYGITVEELEKRNPEIIPNLTIGYKLIIKGTAPKTELIPAIEPKKEITSKITSVKAVEVVKYVNYEVKPKETLFSLSKTFGLTQEELIKLNPILTNSLEIGIILKVPSTPLLPSISPETKKVLTALTNKSNGIMTRKKIVLLLPFNLPLPLIESDSLNSNSNRLKKDKFLNMTLDFYSGALIAIDSAKTLNLPVYFKIFDSQETKSTTNMARIIQQNSLETADAIIGPFYQSNIETTAQLLNSNSVPVISPLSKDIGNAFPNLYQTIPTSDNLKHAIFDYMKSKGGNMIAIIDKKRESTRQYLDQYQKEVKIVPFTDKGHFSAVSFKNLFVKNKRNYVILETGNTVMIKTAISIMVDAMPEYDVQLVVLENNETLDTDEILFENLIKLKLMYPSIYRENESDEALVFKNEYRKKNKVFPNTYATRGFDVTFDTMMRISQDKTFLDCANTIITEQVDNRFDYSKKDDGGYTNKGVFILYYDSDLTIKVAN
jgi:LysM repeat protein